MLKWTPKELCPKRCCTQQIDRLLSDRSSKGYNFHACELDVAGFDSWQACAARIA